MFKSVSYLNKTTAVLTEGQAQVGIMTWKAACHFLHLMSFTDVCQTSIDWYRLALILYERYKARALTWKSIHPWSTKEMNGMHVTISGSFEESVYIKSVKMKNFPLEFFLFKQVVSYPHCCENLEFT